MNNLEKQEKVLYEFKYLLLSSVLFCGISRKKYFENYTSVNLPSALQTFQMTNETFFKLSHVICQKEESTKLQNVA